MHFVRENNGSVYWVGIGMDPVSGKPYRRGVGDPNQWNRWQAAGFPNVQVDAMDPNDYVTLPPTGPAVSAAVALSSTDVQKIADAAKAGAQAGSLTVQQVEDAAYRAANRAEDS